MTEQQFKRACEIKKRLDALKNVESKFKSLNLRLRFSYESACHEVRVFCDSEQIMDLLDKHDKMIRQEIEDEIESLKKEIEKL